MIITQNREPKAVLQDPKSYENMRNAIGILKLISLGEQAIRAGRVKPQKEVFDLMEKMLEEKGQVNQGYEVIKTCQRWILNQL